jgi:hypothetical protein
MCAGGLEAMSGSGASTRNSQSHTPPPKHRHFLLRPLLDASAAGIVFVLLTAVMTSAPVRACPFSVAFSGLDHKAAPFVLRAVAKPEPAPITEIATTSSAWAPNAVFRRTSDTAAWSLLGISFSLLTALNLAFFRHLRRTYAPRAARNSARK